MYRIGIDLGGTNIAAGVVDEGQHIVAEVSLPTGAERPAEAVVADICRAAEKAMEKAGITAAHCASVGIGSPGTCDSANGVVVRAYNLGWFNVPVCSMVTARLGLPCHLSNDANCAALAETVAGGAVGCRNMILITLGTGVGGGIVADGQLLEGVGGTGAEVGHTVLVLDGEDCTCGRKGCWEAYASATALIRQGKRAAAAQPESLLAGYGEGLTGKDVFDAAAAGDAAAQAGGGGGRRRRPQRGEGQRDGKSVRVKADCQQAEACQRRCRRKKHQQKPMKNFHKTEPFLFPEYGAHSAGKHLFIDDSTLIPVCP